MPKYLKRDRFNTVTAMMCRKWYFLKTTYIYFAVTQTEVWLEKLSEKRRKLELHWKSEMVQQSLIGPHKE